MFRNRRIARSLAALLAISALQTISGIQAPYSLAAAGTVGSTTASGTCVSNVGETTYVTATFVNNAFCLIKVSTSTSWTVPSGVNTIDILVVGGGGGGGSDGGGGGGGGEVRTATGISVSAGISATVTVGTGGIGNIHGQTNATNGNTSSLVINGTTYSAGGGLKAVNWQSAAYYAPGGSGGTGGTQLTGATDYSKGGRNSVQNDGYAAGGYGTVGYAGVTTSFTGTSTVFAGGGGGGICTNTKSEATFGGLAGGAGGGGRGALHTQNVGSDAGQPGTNGLGGGGGGGSACNDGLNDGVTSRTAGGRGGDGVVYIKFVPVPAVSTNPTSTTAEVGSAATFTAATQGTIAGATRSVKWQVLTPGGSWADISGATSDTYVTPASTRTMHGNQYRYVTTDTVGTISSTSYSAAATLTVIPPAQGDTDTAISKDASGYNYAYLLVPGSEAIKALSGDTYTAEAWVRPTSACSGTYCAIAGREGDWLLAFSNNELTFITYNVNTWGSWQATGVNIPLNQWSHVALTKNSTTWTLYVNGTKTYSATLSYSPLASSGYYFYVGERWGGGYTFNGSIDEVKLWRTDRSASIASDMNSTSTGPGMLAYWNFNEGSGTTAYNQVPGAVEGSDFTLPANDLWDANVVSTQTTSGPYTVRTFYRSYFNITGGWKSPAGISRVTTLLVAGGGGGGGGLNGGGGGAGGFIETTTAVLPSTYYQIRVGAGGVGAISGTYAATAPTNGTDSTALSLTAVGGGRGSAEFNSPYGHYAATTGGSGGGGSWGNNSANYTGRSGTSGQGNSGGNSGSLSGAYAGAGGGGASTTSNGIGSDATSSSGGAGGVGRLSVITGNIFAGGGGGSLRNGSNGAGTGGSGGAGGGGAASSSGSAGANVTNGAQSGSANTGGGGGAGVFQGAATDGKGAQGGTGIVVIRWITAFKPTYTAPTNAYLNVGMTETFTTNVAQDSATAVLTRTFRWESSTTGVSGTYSLIKQGTGAANSSFAWIPTDTSTSGSTYAYRVIVTDSDTAGLFIVDTSTPVWAVINKTLIVSGNSTIAKAINAQRNETFTIQFGTPTWRPTLLPVIPGITLDTSTAGYAVVTISDTASVGTYYETLTVVDSVSATIVTPLTIIIAAPPTLLNSADIVTNDLVFNLDAGNSQSLLGTNGVSTSGLTWNDISGRKANATTGASVNTGGYGGTACTAPTYSTDGGGSVVFTGSSDNCYYTTYTGTDTQKSYTVEAWFKTSATLPVWGSILSQSYPNSGANISISIGSFSGSAMYVGFFDGGTWRYANCGYTPTIGVWTHIAGTYDGTTMYTYINGSNSVGGVANCSAAFTGGFGSTANFAGIIIGKSHIGSAATAFPGSIASVRIYKKALSAAQILANYNATKDRFITAGGLLTSFTQKYGVNQAESYTVTSGYGSRNVTFAVGDRTGIDWDTTTVVNQVKLSIQESLTVGMYNDTVTVTDALGQSTYLPIKVSIAKADTITVTLRNPKTLTYTGSPAALVPDISIVGLKSSDTGTVTRLYSAPASLPGSPETYTALVNSSVVPTDVESYTVTSSALTLSVGSLSNYESVTYESSSLIIVQAKQPGISVSPYGAYVGAPYTVVVIGGAGGGLISETVTAGSTASGCAVSNHVLTMTSTFQSYCSLDIAKAASRNYLRETATVQVYFFLLAINQPAPAPSSGPGVALSGATSTTLDPNQAPTISSLSVSSGRVGDTVIITGAGFTASALQSVKFWRNILATVTGTTTNTQITVIVPAGATTGKILVTTANGLAITEGSFTVLP